MGRIQTRLLLLQLNQISLFHWIQRVGSFAFHLNRAQVTLGLSRKLHFRTHTVILYIMGTCTYMSAHSTVKNINTKKLPASTVCSLFNHKQWCKVLLTIKNRSKWNVCFVDAHNNNQPTMLPFAMLKEAERIPCIIWLQTAHSKTAERILSSFCSNNRSKSAATGLVRFCLKTMLLATGCISD